MKEQFVPFFVRRELGIPLRLKTADGRHGECGIDWADKRAPEFKGALIVTLNQRAARLGFLARLLQAIARESVPGDPGTQDILDNGGGYFRAADTAFLTDGWGDLILILQQGRKDKEPPPTLSRLFKIQEIVSSDFMVDRTEMILAPSCIKEALANPGEFEIQTSIKMKEDRLLSNAKTHLLDHMKRAMDDVSSFKLALFRTPGQTNMMVRFVMAENPAVNIDGKKAWKDFRSLFECDQIDSLMTTIGKRERSVNLP